MIEPLNSSNDATPIFGLTKSQLQPIVDNIVPGETVVSFDILSIIRFRGFADIWHTDKPISLKSRSQP